MKVNTPDMVSDPSRSGLLLSARGLTKNYGKDRAVDSVDLDIPERAFTTFLGPSGCGKTTILRMIAGFETPDAGSIVLDGRSLSGVPPERRPVNTVFQSYALFPHLTVFGNVAFSLTLRRHSNVDVAARVKGRWTPCTWRSLANDIHTSSRVASSSGWRWPAPSSPSRTCFCSTNPFPRWIRRCGGTCRSN